jgi:hypothetical protein
MWLKFPEQAGQSYQPSNGTEGEYFMEDFCYQCLHDQDPDKGCVLIMLSIFRKPGDPDYPKEWIYNQDGEPTCTKFYRKEAV